MNSRFFASITTEPQAYWLGVLLAKGRVMAKKDGTPYLTMRSKHYELAEGLINALGDLQVTGVGERGQFAATFHDQELIEDLACYGVVPGKSQGNYLAEDYEHVPDDLFRHLLRGFFDGNGHIDIYGRVKASGGQRIRVVVGSSDLGFIEYVRANVQRLAGIYMNLDTHAGYGVKNARILGRKGTVAFRDWLYQGATVFLEEKRRELDNLPAESDRPPGINKGLVQVSDEVVLILRSLQSVASNGELAEMMGVKKDTLRRVACGYTKWTSEEFVDSVLAFCREHRVGPFAIA